MNRDHTKQAYPCAETVHSSFQGAAELAKLLRKVALATEVAAASIAALRIFLPDMVWPGWASLALAMVVILGGAVQLWARSVISHADKCRRVSVRAYARGMDISQAKASSLVVDNPAFTSALASRLPTKSLDEYYESKCPAGPGRVREIYAHSAFYTWRLRRSAYRIYFSATLLFALIGFLAIYALAADPTGSDTSSRVLDMVCSVVFVFLVAKAARAAFETRQSYVECRRIADALLATALDSDPAELAAEYDIEMSSGITNSTLLYKWMRDSLQREWQELRPELITR